jgi:hypothetical protein
VLAVGTQAKFFGCGEYYGGYYPYAGLRATTAYTGIPATAAVPAAFPVACGYPSVSATQYHAQDELGQASFGYAQLLTLDRPPATCATVSATQKARKFYTADSRGFRVQSNNFPVTPAQIEDTPEEPAAKTEFAIKSALNLLLPRKPLPRPPVLSANSTHVLQSLRTTINVISTCPLL